MAEPEAAIVFDVDGVLLNLTSAEEDIFFLPFLQRYGLTGLSRDWDSYRIRNDHDIITEIVETHGLPKTDIPEIIEDYENAMSWGLQSGSLVPEVVDGAVELLAELSELSVLGIATANLLSIAKLRLAAADLWTRVSRLPYGAEGGGHKREILSRAVRASGLGPQRIVYIGDNLNDVEAGLVNGVHFVGFSMEESRRERLRAAGAVHLSGDHVTTGQLIATLLMA
ncbi:MAG: HAD family hydrolase [Alphaproteobacteria bacterium]|nr:HAD family hydrolase [Alphaproteobacteria bacterium]